MPKVSAQREWGEGLSKNDRSADMLIRVFSSFCKAISLWNHSTEGMIWLVNQKQSIFHLGAPRQRSSHVSQRHHHRWRAKRNRDQFPESSSKRAFHYRSCSCSEDIEWQSVSKSAYLHGMGRMPFDRNRRALHGMLPRPPFHYSLSGHQVTFCSRFLPICHGDDYTPAKWLLIFAKTNIFWNMAFEPWWFLNVFDWLVVSTPLKNMNSSVGMMKFPTEWEKTHVPNHQTVIINHY